MGALYLLHLREGLLDFQPPSWQELKKFWAALLKVAMPISAANMLTPIAAAILTALVARFGEQAVAALGAGTRIEAMSMIVIFALTSALSPYMAQNLGAGNIERARQALALSLRFTLIFQFCIYLLVALTAPWLAAIFSKDPAVIELSRQYLYIVMFGSIFYALIIIINTAFNSAKQPRKTFWLTLIRVFLCLAPCAWLGGVLWGYQGLLAGTVLGNGIACWVAWRMLHTSFDTMSREEALASQHKELPL